jgi:hypothetical protein
LFPDIMDFTSGEVAEIKPLSFYGVMLGELQLGIYLDALNGFTVWWRGQTYSLPALPNQAVPPKPWTGEGRGREGRGQTWFLVFSRDDARSVKTRNLV